MKLSNPGQKAMYDRIKFIYEYQMNQG